MPQLAEDPLIDRLKELGMDFVADVLHGKIRPTRQQSDMLSRGYADPVPQETGTVVVGGCADGRRVKDLGHDRINLPALPGRLRFIQDRDVSRSIDYDSYHIMRLETGDWAIRVFVVDRMDDDEALSRLVNCYGRSLTDTMD